MGTGALTESLNTFFKPVLSRGYFLTDPRVLYDSANHRFIVAVDEVSNRLVDGSKVVPRGVEEFWTFTRPAGLNFWMLSAIQAT